MYSSIFTAFLIGLVPVWGLQEEVPASFSIDIAAPFPFVSQKEKLQSAFANDSLSASGILILDADSGQRLYEYASQIRRPMASLTKLMTALIITEDYELDEWVTVPDDIAEVSGNKAYLPAKSRFTVGDLLSALLMRSANDAAVTLAKFHSGTVTEFVKTMNDRTKALGLKDTSFANPTGLDAFAQHSTPQDLAWLMMYVLREPAIRERLSMRGAQIKSYEGEIVYLTHTHALLHADTAVIAGKTGTTLGAGECLISLIQNNGRSLLVILLNSLNRYADMRVVLDALAV
jgi:serine-type D-Ala-D-Ala carboxypeptidase (penicillin-binding protein 5/6)